MADEIEKTPNNYADTTKLCRTVSHLKDWHRVQNDLVQLGTQSGKTLIVIQEGKAHLSVCP